MTRRPFQLLACLLLALSCSHAAFAATKLPFRSSFESGGFNDWDGGADASLSVVSGTASDGSRSARAVMNAGRSTDNYKDYVFGDNPRVRGEPVDAQRGLWLAFDARFDNGFRFGTGSNLHKMAILNFEDENGRRRYQLILNVRNGNQEYFLEHLKWNADRSFNRAIPGLDQHLGTPARVRFGQWDRFKLYVKPNTPGRSDGVVRLWINDDLKVERTQVAVREGTSYNPNKMILSNYAPDATTSGVQYWDNFYLGESDPDQVVRPSPPVLRGVD